jgi:hypothetical protein
MAGLATCVIAFRTIRASPLERSLMPSHPDGKPNRVQEAEESVVILALCAAAYLALPLVVAALHWRGGRRLSAVAWLLACVVVPVLVGWVALQALEARLPPQRDSGDALDMVANAALIALGAWLGLCGVAWLSYGWRRARP